MGRTACTEPQCLYKGALYLYLLYCGYRKECPVSSFSCCVSAFRPRFMSRSRSTRVVFTRLLALKSSDDHCSVECFGLQVVGMNELEGNTAVGREWETWSVVIPTIHGLSSVA